VVLAQPTALLALVLLAAVVVAVVVVLAEQTELVALASEAMGPITPRPLALVLQIPDLVVGVVVSLVVRMEQAVTVVPAL
jgi:hypothetical protein